MTIPTIAALQILGVVVLATLARVGHWQLFTKRLKITYVNAPAWTFLYFSAFSIAIALLFRGHIARLFAGVNFFGYLILTFLFVVVFPLVYHVLRKQGGVPEWLIRSTKDEPILSLGERFILAKVADVVMQEFAAGIIILTLFDAGISYPWIVFASVIIFGLAHAYIFQTSGAFWGMYYTSYAMLAGFAIPFLILFVSGGIAYALVLHMLFYVLSGAFFA
ncbi:MAG TPA: hypothetical protein VHC20_00605, partial [Candidatus Paceibacterota bacterium]|nr:hypothetical protein [Candidatus Paceibacterota bacterium]